MDQTFIKVDIFDNEGNFVKKIDKDILETTGNERLGFYNAAVKTELSIIIEKLLKEKLRGEK